MTNPILGADSERAAFEEALIEYLQSNRSSLMTEEEIADHLKRAGWNGETYTRYRGEWFGWELRAAAKVGANVAADIPTWHDRREGDRAVLRSHGEDDKGLPLAKYMQAEIADLRKFIAAGAPAETTDQVRANFENWYVTHIDGAVIGSADCAARWSAWLAGSTGHYKAPSDWKIAPMPWGAPAETPKPIGYLQAGTHLEGFNNAKLGDYLRLYALPFPTREMVPVYLAAQPSHAPIAGDVEKDAFDAKRYRKIKADNDDCDAETFCLFFDSKSGGLISIESKDMDAELDAAMLANSSSGEAG